MNEMLAKLDKLCRCDWAVRHEKDPACSEFWTWIYPVNRGEPEPLLIKGKGQNLYESIQDALVLWEWEYGPVLMGERRHLYGKRK